MPDDLDKLIAQYDAAKGRTAPSRVTLFSSLWRALPARAQKKEMERARRRDRPPHASMPG